MPETLLIVDDDASNREIARTILELEGYRVALCDHGAAAVSTCIAMPTAFKAILMDVAMPVMDGMEATRRLRAHPTTAQLPILCVSGLRSIEAQAMAAGCDGFLAKPFRRQALLHAVAEVIEARTLVAGKR